VLSLIEQHIRHHDNASDHTLFLVDLLPNLQEMVTNSNISQDVPEHLSQFEAQLPIAFALYLTLSEVSLSVCVYVSVVCSHVDIFPVMYISQYSDVHITIQ